jgi:hypothetical protein
VVVVVIVRFLMRRRRLCRGGIGGPFGGERVLLLLMGRMTL